MLQNDGEKTLIIGPAEPDDEAGVTALLCELRGPLGEEGKRTAARTYARYLARPDTYPLVARVNGQVVGFCSLEFRDRLGLARPHEAWIPDLVVHPEARRMGIARRLLARAFAEAARRDCFRLLLESGYRRTAAHALYRAAGMSEAGYYYTCVPEAEPDPPEVAADQIG